jgi:hypothetical protein
MTYIKLPVDYTKLRSYQKKFIREEYIKVQNGLCAFCKEPLNGPAIKEVTSKPINKKLFPAGFFNAPVHLHHDHDTGMTIGAIHSHCNAYLWQYYGE